MNRGINSRKGWRTALASLLLLGGTERAWSQSCVGEESEPPAAALSWTEVPSASASARGNGLTLEVTNTSGGARDLVVHVIADFGGRKQRTVSIEVPRLAADASTTVPVSLVDFRAPATMAFSGQIYALATAVSEAACADDACEKLKRNPDSDLDIDADGSVDPSTPPLPTTPEGPDDAVSPSVFFHPSDTPGLFELYGAEVLATTHAGGALDARGIETLDDPDAEVVRVMDAGRGGSASARMLAELDIATVDEQERGAAPRSARGVDPAPADGYRLCIQWDIQLTEQGRIIVLPGGGKITEDYWHGHPKSLGNGFQIAAAKPVPGRMWVGARGPKVLIKKGSWSLSTYADPATGCFSFTTPEAPPFSLFVYGQHRDKDDNITVVKSKAGKSLAWNVSISPTKGKTRTVQVGNADGNATLAAAAAFSLYRSAFGLTGKTIDLRAVDTCFKKGANASSAHVNFSGLDDGIAYLQFSDGTGEAGDGSGPCTKSDHRRAKFIVTHELGHSMYLLRTKVAEPNVDLGLTDAYETECNQGESYTADSMEFAAVGAREGSAHFYSTLVWNNPKSSNAVFSLFGSGRNVETYTNEKGGQLWNDCTSTIKCGRSVNMDWLRFWWDWHTPFKPGKPTAVTVAKIYARAIANGGLTADTYFQKFRAAMLQEVSDPAQRAAFDNYADWNGVDTSPFGPHCIAPYSYPDCGTNPPEFGAGEVGCPCTDVLPLNPNSVHDAASDGYFADGDGSYKATGDPQFCIDTNDAPAVCNLVKNANSSIYAPVCQVCGEDTMLGCPCQNSDQCDGLDSEDLDCFGAPADGWQGGKDGTCLPSAATPAGRERLIDLPWFCLDNCGAKSGGGDDTYVCIYDQLGPEYVAAHGQCTDAVFCSAPSGHCESAGQFCDTEASCNDWDDCCVAECSNDAHCDGLGFPDDYSCDAGSCVPFTCVGSFSQFCSLYR